MSIQSYFILSTSKKVIYIATLGTIKDLWGSSSGLWSACDMEILAQSLDNAICHSFGSADQNSVGNVRQQQWLCFLEQETPLTLLQSIPS